LILGDFAFLDIPDAKSPPHQPHSRNRRTNIRFRLEYSQWAERESPTPPIQSTINYDGGRNTKSVAATG